MKFKLLFSFLLAAISAQLFGQACVSNRYSDTVFHQVTTTSGVKYGNAMPYNSLISQDLYLDIYEPTGDTLGNRPVIVYAFGGAFLIGNKIQPPIPTYCEYFAKCGYVVVAIDYRIGFNTLSTGSTERAVYRAAQDLRAAVRFLAQRASQYRIDTAAIFLTGSSAGCFSGLHSTFMEPSQRPASTYGITLEPSNLGCFDCSGNTDNNQHMPKPRGIINHWGAILDTSFMDNSPHHNVPVISFHGDQDDLVPYDTGNPFGYPVFPVVYGSKPIHRRLTNIGIENELVTLAGYGHEPWLLSTTLTSVLDTAFKRTKPFLLKVLKPAPLAISGDSIVCAEETGNYSVALRNGSRYCWTISGGGYIVAQNNHQLSVKWTTNGSFTVRVRELSLNDVNGDEFSFTVNVIARPHADFGLTANGLTVIFSDSSQGAVSWKYSFGDGASSSVQNPTHSYPVANSYTIQQIVSNGFCEDTSYKSIVLETCPRADFTVYQSGDSVYFTGNASNGVSFQWEFGDGNTGSGLTPTHAYTEPGNYLATFYITNAKGCKDSISKIITIEKTTNSIRELKEAGIEIYPNPARDFVQVKCQECIIKLSDMNGRIISRNNIITQEKIALTGGSSGFYLLEIKTNTAYYTAKIIKE